MAGKILDNGMAVTLGLVAAVAAVGAANKAGLYGSRAHAGADTRSIWVWKGYKGPKSKRPDQMAYALDRKSLPLDSAEVEGVEAITVSTASPEYDSAVHNSRRALGDVKGVWRVSGYWPGDRTSEVEFYLTRRDYPFLGSHRIRDLKPKGVEIRIEHVFTDTRSDDYANAVENERIAEAMGVRMAGKGSAARRTRPRVYAIVNEWVKFRAPSGMKVAPAEEAKHRARHALAGKDKHWWQIMVGDPDLEMHSLSVSATNTTILTFATKKEAEATADRIERGEVSVAGMETGAPWISGDSAKRGSAARMPRMPRMGKLATMKKPVAYRYRRTPTKPGMYENVEMPGSLLSKQYAGQTFTVDVNTDDANWTKGAWLVAVGSGYQAGYFLVFGRSEDDALANAIDLAAEVAPGWTTQPGDPDLEEALEQYDGEGYATDDGSVYLGHFDTLRIERLGADARTLLAEKGISLR